jgi:hypothetical protein
MKVPTRLGILAAVAASAIVYARVVRPWQRTWGATPEEATRVLPGDELVTGGYRTTHAVTITRPAGQVWPWLVQMGYERGGWYSYDRLERALGVGDFAEGRSARRIVPHLQSLTVGDTVALSGNGGFTVVGLDPARSLVLRIPMDPLTGGRASAHSRVVLDWTWAFVLEPVDQGCRLLIRVRGDLRPRWLTPTLLLLDPVHLIMERKMLRTIKQCAEAHEPQGPSTRTPDRPAA